jgi:PKD repeat protein
MKRLVWGLFLLLPLALGGCTLDGLFGDLVNQPPEAVIDAEPTHGDAPLTVRFDAGYSHDDHAIAQYYWDFGDPRDVAPLSTVTAAHTYLYPGTYAVKLTVIDESGALNSEKVAIVVVNPPPVPSFSMSTDNPRAGDAVTFDASATYDANGEVVDYSWDFGDGGTKTGAKVDHAYTKEGDYVATLTATDNEGATASVRHSLTVEKGSSGCGGGSSGGTCGGDGDIPLAVISGLPSCAGGKVGVPIHFDGSASRASSGALVRYDWDFGDGTTGSGALVDHAYSQTGRFLVVLTVTDEGGREGTAAGAVSIGSSCY